MGLSDDVICNHDLFGAHKGETCQADIPSPFIPGSTYEITPQGRLELLECVFEDRSDPNATGWGRLEGASTPVFTGARRDLDYHGWLDLDPIGRAKFTDGGIVAFEPNSASSFELRFPAGEDVQQGEESAPSINERANRSKERTAWMEVLFAGARQRELKPIPFLEKLVATGGGLDDATKKRWVEDVERRLRDVLQGVSPRPTVLGYVINRVDEGLILCTVTAKQVGKREVALLCAGQWPCWEQIIRAVPEFDGTHVAFDAVSRHEWCRRWDIRLQEKRFRVEHGIFS